MFTGIVEEMGVLKSIRKGAHSAILEIQAKVVLEDIHLGDSIAVNGVCLTATSFSPTGFTADVMHETLNRSSLGLPPPRPAGSIWSEPWPANGRFGGHIVAGHVDGVGTVQRIDKDDNAIWYTIAAGPEVLQVCGGKRLHHHRRHQPHGGPCGQPELCHLRHPPHRCPSRSWPTGSAGDIVNLETDIIGKYVEKLLHCPPGGSGTRAEAVLRYHQGISHPLRLLTIERSTLRMFQYNTIEEALEDLRQGRMILCTDDPDRENEGDLICAAEFATTENVNFMATHAKGLICMPMIAGIRPEAPVPPDGHQQHGQP